MAGLQLNLFGKPEVILDGAPVTAFETTKVQALLYYLAVTGRPHSRDALATLLWGDHPEATAKRNLTKALTNLRQLVEPYLLLDRYSVAFDLQLPAVLDVTIFQAAVEGSAPLKPENLERDLAPLRKAVGLYRGDFLEGFYVKNALEFEEWALGQREYLRELMLQALRRLTEHSARLEADPASALEYVQRWLVLEPWQEEAHRHMMLLLARSGQRSAALFQYETCRRVLAGELGVEPMAETTALYERLKAAATPPPHNLPLPSPFVGREAELDHLVKQLDEPTCRLVTLLGPGGIGKTRLAVEVARRWVEPGLVLGQTSFEAGVYLVNLASMAAEGDLSGLSDRLAAVVGDALNLPFQGSADLLRQLFNHLRPKKLLLVLDSFEHLVAEAPLLAALLQNAPGLKLLVTSRERLNLVEEWVIEMSGLAYPSKGTGKTGGLGRGGASHATEQRSPFTNNPLSTADLESYSAIALFVRQAQQVRNDFELTKTNTPHVIRICQLVEGLPLGLELAASWLRVLSCQEITAEIERGFDFLATSLRNVPERHRSLQAVFESSWKLLSANERVILQKLSIFWGGFRREAAQEVAEASLSTLASLVDKSLLRRAATGRYEMHELVRQYAAEKLAQQPAEIEEIRRRHCRYFAQFLQQRADRLQSDQQARTLRELAAEFDNIRTGWQYAIAPGRPPAAAEINQYIHSLRTLYERRGWYQEGLAAFSQMAQRLAKGYGANSSPEYHIAYGRTLLQAGFFHHLLGHYQSAAELYQQSLQVLQASRVTQPDIIRDQAYTMRMLSNIYMRQGEYRAAEKQLTEGIALLKTIGDTYQEAHLTNYLGMLTFFMGNYEQAERLLRQSRNVFEAAGDRWDLADIIGYLGQIAYILGREAEAEQLLAESLSMSHSVGDPWVIMRALQHRGYVLNLMAQAASIPAQQRQIYTEAKRTFQQSLAISRDIDSAFYQAFSLNQLGYSAIGLGEGQIAQEYFIESLKIAEKLGATPLILDTLVGLAMLLMQSSQSDIEHPKQAPLFLNLALSHAAVTHQTHNRATALLAKAGLTSEMSPPMIDHHKTKPLELVVAEILDKTGKPTQFTAGNKSEFTG